MEWLLDPGVAYLNHGSYGACPRSVLEAYQGWQLELERQPVDFLWRRLPGLLDGVREALGAFVGASPADLALVPNATTGLNAAIRSLRLAPGDEVLTTAHEYGALLKTWQAVGARLVTVAPERLAESIGPRTRVVFASHIASPTACVLPVADVCAAARAAGVLSIVDGAHAPGHVSLAVAAVGADVYAGNCHKWLGAPKGAGFLWARPEHHGWVEPVVTSWGWGPGAGFAAKHEWQGTFDPAAWLSVPAAIETWRAIDLGRRSRSRRGGGGCSRRSRACPRRACGRRSCRPATPTSCNSRSGGTIASRCRCTRGRASACCVSPSPRTTTTTTWRGSSTRYAVKS